MTTTLPSDPKSNPRANRVLHCSGGCGEAIAVCRDTLNYTCYTCLVAKRGRHLQTTFIGAEEDGAELPVVPHSLAAI